MSKKDSCEVYCYDEEKVIRIQGELEKEDISSVAQLFKALADENRAKISYGGSVRKMRIYNAKHIFETIPPFLTTLRKFQWS